MWNIAHNSAFENAAVPSRIQHNSVKLIVSFKLSPP